MSPCTVSAAAHGEMLTGPVSHRGLESSRGGDAPGSGCVE
jgi:hypothetical protein